MNKSDIEKLINKMPAKEKEAYEENVWWARWWFRHLLLNENYKSYCKAKEEKDADTIKQLESKWIRINYIYKHWGDIYKVNIWNNRHYIFRIWYEEHKHLFIETKREIKEISEANEIQIEGAINLAIPLYDKKVDTQRQLKAYIDKVYQKRKDNIPNNNPLFKLNKTKNRLSIQTKQAVEKSSNAYHASLLKHDDGKIYTAVEQVIAICESEEDGIRNTNVWGWFFSNEEKEAMKLAESLKTDERIGLKTSEILKDAFRDKIRVLRRYKKMHNEMVENTVKYATFPKYEKA